MKNYICSGCIPDPKDKVYIPFDKSQLCGITQNSDNIDLREYSFDRHDQGSTNTCVANATTKALEIKRAEKFGVENHIPLSRLDLYYGARDLMNPKRTNVDDGTNISLAMDVLRRFGVCREKIWPFDPNKISTPTSILGTREAALNKISGHFKIDSSGNKRIDDIILNLKAKNPVVFGMKVGEEFRNYTASSEPISKSTNIIGGHAMVLVGYLNGLFIGENSWGTWGQNGFYFITPELIGSDIAYDFWVMATNFDIYWENMNKDTV